MWVLGKIRESVESIPLELSRHMGKKEQDVYISSKNSLSRTLHENILTPDKIPDFCLPPRLCRRSPQLAAETTPPHLRSQRQVPCLKPTRVNNKDAKVKKGDALVTSRPSKTPAPFSAEGYGLAGLYESPNTRRKESLFHSKLPRYTLDRSAPTAAPRPAKEPNPPKKTLSGFFPLLFSSQSSSETGSTGSATPSSGDSSALSSPQSAKSDFRDPRGKGRLKGATSCPLLTDSTEDRGKLKMEGLSSQTFPSSLPSSLTLAPPVLFPLDVLQCQERLRREHVLPLQGRGRVRLSAESTTFSTNTLSPLYTVRVRVVSVEGLARDDADRPIPSCAVNLCLTPGKLQQQKSAAIRKRSSPVFNEDFFFTELRREDLLELRLRLKVVDKPAAGTLRRGAVIGVITKPLCQLLHLNKWV